MKPLGKEPESLAATGYQMRRLKYLATINDETLLESTDPTCEIQYIDIGNVSSAGRVANIQSYEFGKAPSRARRRVRDGDVIISTVRTYLQAIAPIVNPPSNLIVSTGFAVVRPRPDFLDPRFCGYALRASRFIWEVESRSVGISYPAINASDLADIPICVPPIEIQRQTVAFLDKEVTRIDALIAQKQCMLNLLEEKRAALVNHTVTRALDPQARTCSSGLDWLGNIPAHWDLQPLKHLAEVRGGLTLGKQYHNQTLTEYPYLRVANVQDGHLNLASVATVFVPPSEAASCLLQAGDVLMNEGGDPDKLGRGAVWRNEIYPCLHQNHVFAVRPSTVEPEWISLWTSTAPAKHYFESRAKQTTNLASISARSIKELPVILPPKAERAAILAIVREDAAQIKELQDSLAGSLRLIRERRSALITAAVTGLFSPIAHT